MDRCCIRKDRRSGFQLECVCSRSSTKSLLPAGKKRSFTKLRSVKCMFAANSPAWNLEHLWFAPRYNCPSIFPDTREPSVCESVLGHPAPLGHVISSMGFLRATLSSQSRRFGKSSGWPNAQEKSFGNLWLQWASTSPVKGS